MARARLAAMRHACLRPLDVRLVEHDRMAGGSEDLGDAVAHQPGAADEDRSADISPAYRVARRSSVPIRRSSARSAAA